MKKEHSKQCLIYVILPKRLTHISLEKEGITYNHRAVIPHPVSVGHSHKWVNEKAK